METLEEVKRDRLLLLILFFLMAISLFATEAACHAQDEPPSKPIPTVRVKLTCAPRDLVCMGEFNARPGQTWYATYPVTHRTADRSYILSVLGAAAFTTADVENSVIAERAIPNGQELNPVFFSKHPTRARYYEIEAPVTAIAALVSWRYKRQDDATKIAGVQGHKWVKWHAPNDLVMLGHALGIAITAASTRK
jgi:hypothetical protein